MLHVRSSAVMALAPTLTFAQPPNDSCLSATPITGFVTIPYNTAGATTDGLPHALCNISGSAQIYRDVWYCWTAHQTGPVLARTCSLTFMDTKIAVYDGCTCPEGSAIIWCSDDRCQIQSMAFFHAVVGRSYLIRLGVKSQTETGTGSVQVLSAASNGPIVNPSNNHTYYLVGPTTWLESESYAVTMGGHLATIRSADENEWVRTNVITFGGFPRPAWIGLNDRLVEGTYVWTSGETAEYRNWAPGEPSAGTSEDHIAMDENGTWHDYVNGPGVPTVYAVVELTPPSCYANCDTSTGSPLLTPNDFVCFINSFAANQSYANCDNSTGAQALTANDFVCFVNAYATGCS